MQWLPGLWSGTAGATSGNSLLEDLNFYMPFPCRLAAQLARTEEAAKRALVQTDATARGGAAQRLLDAERSLQKLRDENAELRNKLARHVMIHATASYPACIV